MSCWACQKARMMLRPSRYSASTCSCPCDSIRMDRPNPRMIAAPIGGNTDSLSQVSTGFSKWLPIRRILKLHRMEPFIVAATKQQLVMGTHFDDRTAIQHDDPIGTLNRRKPMCNH